MSDKIQENKKRILFKIIVISTLAIIFVPVLYSGIYLSAFWDPYGHFNKVPVAFVNLDKPVVKGGKEYHIGKDIENNLKKNNSIDWKFVNYDEAMKGVRGTAYYAAVIIPKDFSQQISQATGGNLLKPKVLYEANKGKNFVFAQVSERAAQSIRSQVASSIQEQITKSLAGSLYDVKTGLLDARNGANTLQEGTGKLLAGSKKLSSGISTAANGAGRLQDGLKQAASGEARLSTGIESLIGGLNQFKSKLTQNTGSISKLETGAHALSDGMSKVTAKTTNANLPQGLTTAANGIGQIKSALGQASSILASSSDPQSIKQVQGILNGVLNTIETKNMEGSLRNAASSAETLTGSLDQLNTVAKQVATGTSTLADTLSSTQSTAATGINQLIDGANKLKSGNDDLTNGLNTAVQKTGDLASGLTTLSTGAADLSNGISDVNDGIIKLSDGLNSGYNKLNNNLKFSAEDIAKFVTNPLTLSDVSINKVRYYGQGLAPYFISLSLWLGAMLINLVISLTKLSKIIQYKFLKTYSGVFLVGSALVMLQSVILSLVLINGLGIDPTNSALFYLENMFISVVFFSIMYGVSYAIGIVGTPIIFILFILQLASSGGTFPIETAPGFFRTVSPYFPMTYTVEGLRMIISGINTSRLIQVTVFLIIFLLIFYIGGYLLNRTFKGLKNIKAEAE